ncbi:Phage terminase-like protein, large subunit, contains N-terminal HTH domain [Nitrosomonas aestuarii]|uniref:Phage terminase-like protein, large subunit, contains N-terminal HTH domain n=1 Tax=Nitrosomonas aestuarii TaxID=52441 RepID=A0A1I4C144_9PROT|nr:terminase TerL endonuclease subunit [Nitrosomonas aestuarii]SFK74798.1 Phage terminase-like protein, large subunit, contains N-terminal HTH domain [Nitrosomonas aestuarii]
MVKTTSRDPVTTYARKVVAGKIIAGPHVRSACQRHLTDLEQAPSRGFFFDLEKVNRVIGFFRDVLRLNGGDYEGKPYELLDWQKFAVGSLFGWIDAEGFRRFRVAYIESGKGSGKSPFVAGIALYGLVADGEMRAEIYAAATKKEQAMVLFRDAVAMVDQSPELLSRLKKSGTGQSVWNLAYLKSSSFFRPISSDEGQSGPRPHISLIDEFHEHKTNHAIEMQRAGFKFRKQPLIGIITNSGSNKKSPCGVYHDYAAQVASGQRIDDEFFSYVCALDEDDDPFKDEKCWHKANPSLKYGLPGKKYIRGQVNEARGMPSKESIVRRLNFCQWTEANNPWISAEIWMGAREIFDWRDLQGRRAYGGLDLGSTTDLTGLVLWVEPIEHGEPWRLVSFAWLPDEGLGRKEELDKVPYLAWKTAGYLETTPGRAISKRFILQRLAELQDCFDIQCIAYDRWRMEDLIRLAEDDGFPLPELIPFGQGFKDMSPALEMFESALLNGEVVHDGHPIMTMCAANAVTVSDAAENRKLDKNKATGRIDLMVAAVMGAGVALGNKVEEQQTPSIAIF